MAAYVTKQLLCSSSVAWSRTNWDRTSQWRRKLQVPGGEVAEVAKEYWNRRQMRTREFTRLSEAKYTATRQG